MIQCTARDGNCLHSRCCSSYLDGCYKRPTLQYAQCRPAIAGCIDDESWLCPGWHLIGQGCPYNSTGWPTWPHTWGIERSIQHTQTYLDSVVTGGYWVEAGYISPLLNNTVLNADNVTQVLQGRRLLLIGGSTTRRLVFHYVYLSLLPSVRNQFVTKEDLFSGAHLNHSTLAVFQDHGWNVTLHRCNAELGYGCFDCRCSCDGGAKDRDDWTDFDVDHVETGTSIHFSWKPEIFTRAEQNALASRWCNSSFQQRPYDLIMYGKGLHDVAFRP
jgi:hypothetical protein